MLRYYAIATVIVLTVAVLATAWNQRDRIRSAVAPSSPPRSYAPASSPHPGFEGQEGSGEAPVRGDAPWALSALPDCLIQQSEATGPIAYVRSKLPKGATAAPAGSVLHFGPCTIFVGNGEALVSRGNDRLRIPPPVMLYRADDSLALLRQTGSSGELRVYTPPEQNR